MPKTKAEKRAQKEAAKKKAQQRLRREKKKVKEDILQFYHMNNFNVIVTDMLNQAFLKQTDNPVLFMINYLLEMNNMTLESYLNSRAENLSDSENSDSSSSSSDSDSNNSSTESSSSDSD